MNNWQGFRLGLKTYSQATSFMFRNKLGWYFIFPVIFNILLFIAGFWSVSTFTDGIITSINELINLESWNFWGSGFLIALIKGFVWLVLRILFFIIYAYIGGYIIIILLSPVYAFLSEKTEEIISGKIIPFNITQFSKDIIRGVLLALRNMAVEIGLT
ncbi:MAG: hypothetical protein N4A74_15195, partial [Carboxylicivirga sp.]|nr:hypothetical protein [Carboxylicivirga sp.]